MSKVTYELLYLCSSLAENYEGSWEGFFTKRYRITSCVQSCQQAVISQL